MKTIGSDAFYRCNKLTSAVIPSGVTNIDSRAFYGCSSLILLSLPNSITSIEESVKTLCERYKDITLDEAKKEKGNIKRQSEMILELLSHKFNVSPNKAGKEDHHE